MPSSQPPPWLPAEPISCHSDSLLRRKCSRLWCRCHLGCHLRSWSQHTAWSTRRSVSPSEPRDTRTVSAGREGGALTDRLTGGAPQLGKLDVKAARQSAAAVQASSSAEQSCRKRCAYDASAVASRPVAATSFWVKVIFCKVRKTAGQLSTSGRAGLWRGDQALLAADAGETRRSSVCIAQAAAPPRPKLASRRRGGGRLMLVRWRRT